MNDVNEFLISDSIDLDSLEKEQRERVATLTVQVQNGKLSLVTLLERYAKSVKDDKILNDDYWDIPIVFQEILAIPSIEAINESIRALFNKIEGLDAKLKNHRHETGKTFSAKPEF